MLYKLRPTSGETQFPQQYLSSIKLYRIKDFRILITKTPFTIYYMNKIEKEMNL